MISIKNISYHYRGYDDTIKNIAFDLNDGDFLAILGNNGVGKSTLLKCFNRILSPKTGSIKLNDEEILTMPQREVAKHIAFVSQSVPDTQLTVHDVVMLGRRPYMKWDFSEEDHEIVHSVMKRLDIVGDIQGRFLSELSGGERQKVMLARALAQQPKVLLLDEPTSSLDISNQYQVLRLISEICHNDNITAIMVIHDINLALRFCDKFLLMRQGEIYRCGDISVMDSTALKEVYGVNAKIVKVEGHYTVLVEN